MWPEMCFLRCQQPGNRFTRATADLIFTFSTAAGDQPPKGPSVRGETSERGSPAPGTTPAGGGVCGCPQGGGTLEGTADG